MSAKKKGRKDLEEKNEEREAENITRRNEGMEVLGEGRRRCIGEHGRVKD